MSATSAMVTRDSALRDELIELLLGATEGKFQAAEIDPSANLFDYGYVDSLTGVVFLAEIEERYGVEIDDMEVVERLNTLDLLAGHIAERRA
ncbi:MAG: acyl carrier protein [Myxococcota bacterium]